MKIIQTPARFYPYIGGVENYVYNLSRNLVKLGHDVSVICANEPKLKDEIFDGVNVKRLDYVGKIANTNITMKLPYDLWKEDFDVLHTHLPTPWSADWSAIISKSRRKPLVMTYHNDIVGFGFADFIARLYNKTMLRLVLGKSDRIIVTNKKQFGFSHFLREYTEKTEVIPPGIDTKRFIPIGGKREEGSISFLSVLDRYHRYKGLECLLNALKIVKDEIKNVKLTVGGSGELLAYYQNMADSLGLKKNVEFAGYIPENRISEFYNKSEVFVLPSASPRQEGFGIVLLEAMACGVPVVTTDIVGVADEIEKEGAGIIVKPMSVKLLADAIVTALKNKGSGKNARKLAEKYDWGIIAKNISKVYSSLSL